MKNAGSLMAVHTHTHTHTTLNNDVVVFRTLINKTKTRQARCI